MAPSNKDIIVTATWILMCITFCNGTQSDINCLKAFKNSMEDPQNFLASWDFSKTVEGYICRFIGVECWHPDENKVLNIQLPNMGLKGVFPVDLADCSSLTGLDLSGNLLYGALPTNISAMLPFVTSLDLSLNNLSGQIPRDLANCSYLNVLRLDNNGFSGRIPGELGMLNRLMEFNVANNSLSGQVPFFRNANVSAESYAGNRRLCGGPLPRCKGRVSLNV